MIEIKSYIGSININDGEKFTLVHEYNEKVKNPRHIDGAIELVVDGLVLISKSQWDLVDQLWIYIINGIESVIDKKEYAVYFPDSQIELRFQQSTSPDKVEMTIGEKSIIHNTQELANALLSEAEKCLKEISRILLNDNYYKEEIQKIHRIRLDLSELYK